MTRKQRFIAAFLALWLGGVATEVADGFLARDRCLDRGGRYIADPDLCELADGAGAALPPRGLAWWATIAAPGVLTAGACYWAVTRVLMRASRLAG